MCYLAWPTYQENRPIPKDIGSLDLPEMLLIGKRILPPWTKHTPIDFFRMQPIDVRMTAEGQYKKLAPHGRNPKDVIKESNDYSVPITCCYEKLPAPCSCIIIETYALAPVTRCLHNAVKELVPGLVYWGIHGTADLLQDGRHHWNFALPRGGKCAWRRTGATVPQTQPMIGHVANIHVAASLLHSSKLADRNDPSTRTHSVFDNPPVPLKGLFQVPAGPGLIVNEAASAVRGIEI